jgi:hypothetical protein
MSDKQIEAILASPPEREDLVVQLFLKDGGQWGEIFRKNGDFLIELYPQPDGHPWRFDANEVRRVIDLSVNELKNRLQNG